MSFNENENISKESFPASLYLDSTGHISDVFHRSRPSTDSTTTNNQNESMLTRRYSVGDLQQKQSILSRCKSMDEESSNAVENLLKENNDDDEPIKRHFQRQESHSTHSKSEQDFVNLNKKKFPHVESKVKKYIDRINEQNPRRIQKQKSLPVLHPGSPLNSSSEKSEETHEDEEEIRKKLKQKETEYKSLKIWLEIVESSLSESKEQNLTLNRKIEEMRGRLDQLSDRRFSAPPNSLEFSSLDACVSSQSTTNKQTANCSVQTDLCENDEFDEIFIPIRSATISGKVSILTISSSSFSLITIFPFKFRLQHHVEVDPIQKVLNQVFKRT